MAVLQPSCLLVPTLGVATRIHCISATSIRLQIAAAQKHDNHGKKINSFHNSSTTRSHRVETHSERFIDIIHRPFQASNTLWDALTLAIAFATNSWLQGRPHCCRS
jgi:hypothetical protein